MGFESVGVVKIKYAMAVPNLEAKRLVTPSAMFSPYQGAVATGPFPISSGAVRHASVSFVPQPGWQYVRQGEELVFFLDPSSNDTPVPFESVAARVLLSTPVDEAVPIGVGYQSSSTKPGPTNGLYTSACASCVQYVNTSDTNLYNTVTNVDTQETYTLATSVGAAYTGGFAVQVGGNTVVICYDKGGDNTGTCGFTNVSTKTSLADVPAAELVGQASVMGGAGYTYANKDYFYGTVGKVVYFNNLTDGNVTTFNGSTVPSSVTFVEDVKSVESVEARLWVGLATTGKVARMSYSMVATTMDTPGTLNGTTSEDAVAYYLNHEDMLCVVTASGFYELQGATDSPARPLWNPIARLAADTSGWRGVCEVVPGERWTVGTDDGLLTVVLDPQRTDLQVFEHLTLGRYGVVLPNGLGFANNTQAVLYTANVFTPRDIETVTALHVVPQLLGPPVSYVNAFPARAFQHVSLQTYGFAPMVVSVGGDANGPRVYGYDLDLREGVGVTYTRTSFEAADPAARILVPHPVRALLSVTLGACGRSAATSTSITYAAQAFDGSHHMFYACAEGVYKYYMVSAVEELALAQGSGEAAITRVWPLNATDFWFLQDGQLKLFQGDTTSTLNVNVGANPSLILISHLEGYLLNIENGTLWKITTSPLGATVLGTPLAAPSTPLVRASNRSTVCFMDATFATLYQVNASGTEVTSTSTTGLTPVRALSAASVPQTGDGGLGLVAFTSDSMVFLRESDATWVLLATGAPSGFTAAHAADQGVWVLEGPAGLQTAVPRDGALEMSNTTFGTSAAQNGLGNDLSLWTSEAFGLRGGTSAVTQDFQLVQPSTTPAPSGLSTPDKVALALGIVLILGVVAGAVAAIILNRKRLFRSSS